MSGQPSRANRSQEGDVELKSGLKLIGLERGERGRTDGVASAVRIRQGSLLRRYLGEE